MNDPLELLKKQEKLLPELEDYLQNEGRLGLCLKHPMVFGVPYTPVMNAFYNSQYKQRQEILEESLIQKKWNRFVFLHERPYRFQAFLKIFKDLTDKEYWEILGEIWIDSENLWQNKSIIKFLLNSDRPQKQKMMDEEEIKMLDSLPNEITVYRGHEPRNKMGYSWSLSYNKARWFSNRFLTNENGKLTFGLCNKQDIVAVLLGRGEFEIVVDPKNIINIQTMRSLRRPLWLAELLNIAQKAFVLGRGSHHGYWHWDKVERNSIQLARLTPGSDMNVCRAFAILHDCQRQEENQDPDHGQRAANFIKLLDRKLFPSLNPKQFDLLIEACDLHNSGKIHSDPTIGVCWDADRLDLPRVGVAPNPKLMSTDAGKQMIWRI